MSTLKKKKTQNTPYDDDLKFSMKTNIKKYKIDEDDNWINAHALSFKYYLVLGHEQQIIINPSNNGFTMNPSTDLYL